MHSSQCLNFNHDTCDVKACQCICHDIICPECNGYRFMRGRNIPYSRKSAAKVTKYCPKCGGKGRLSRNYNLVIPEMKPDEDVPF